MVEFIRLSRVFLGGRYGDDGAIPAALAPMASFPSRKRSRFLHFHISDEIGSFSPIDCLIGDEWKHERTGFH